MFELDLPLFPYMIEEERRNEFTVWRISTVPLLFRQLGRPTIIASFNLDLSAQAPTSLPPSPFMNPNSILPSSLNPISTTTNPPRTLSSPFPLPDAAPFAQPPSAVQDVYATKSTAGKKDKGKARIRYGYGPQLGGARKWNEDEFEDLDSHGERGPIGHDQSSYVFSTLLNHSLGL
jgi:hypothetical protein